MYNEWSLDVFYKGTNDPSLAADLKKLEDTVAEYKAAIASLDKTEALSELRKIIDIKESITLLLRRIAGYFSLRRSANSADTEGAAYMTKIQILMASTAKENVAFEKFVGDIENIDSLSRAKNH